LKSAWAGPLQKRRPQRTSYRCSLPGLAGFDGLRRRSAASRPQPRLRLDRMPSPAFGGRRWTL